MNDLSRQLVDQFARSFDRYQSHLAEADPMSLEDIKRVSLLNMEMLAAQWAASLDHKTKHDLMKTSINAIK